MQKITPFLWFNEQAEEAAQFYVSIFPNSKLGSVTRTPPGGPATEGSVLTVSFTLDGTSFTALNGGPQFPFTNAVSFVIHCETQQEVDTYWKKLSEGGREDQCGWVQDKYGLSWQVVPTVLLTLIADKDKERASRAMQAMLKMKKLDIRTLKMAADAK